MSEPRLHGHATVEGTARGAESWGAGARTLGRTGLSVSPVGFRGQRVRQGSPLHRRALADALRGGVNLVDAGGLDGEGEALAGLVLCNLVQQGEVRREQVVVVSRAGELDGEGLPRARAAGVPEGEAVALEDGAGRCIHPAWLRRQLDESLRRAGLERLDVLLLHEPERALEDAGARALGPAAARERLRARLEAAFAHLEHEVHAGRLGWYGVSSGGLARPADDPMRLSPAEVVAAARAAGGDDHHLGVLQLPMNLLELGALTHAHPTASGPRSALGLAQDHDLGVLVSRPLDAWGRLDGREQLVRLAAQPCRDAGAEELGQALARVRKLEAQWATGLGARLRTEDGSDDAVDLFRWGQELSRNAAQLGSLEQWQRLRYEVIAPHLGRTSASLLGALEGEAREQFAAWWEAYGTAMHGVLTAIEDDLGRRHRAQAEALAEQLDPHLPLPWRALPLSRKAVLSLLGAPVSSVLVGMRQPGYVADMLTLREHPVRLLSAAAGAADLSAIGQALERFAGA